MKDIELAKPTNLARYPPGGGAGCINNLAR